MSTERSDGNNPPVLDATSLDKFSKWMKTASRIELKDKDGVFFVDDKDVAGHVGSLLDGVYKEVKRHLSRR